MATATLPSSPSFPQFVITAAEVARYAELTSLLTQLEKQKDELRAELLELYADGAEQEETGPYLLNFVDQERRTVDWKSEALSLAATVYGVEGLTAWKIQMEQSAHVQNHVHPGSAESCLCGGPGEINRSDRRSKETCEIGAGQKSGDGS